MDSMAAITVFELSSYAKERILTLSVPAHGLRNTAVCNNKDMSKVQNPFYFCLLVSMFRPSFIPIYRSSFYTFVYFLPFYVFSFFYFFLNVFLPHHSVKAYGDCGSIHPDASVSLASRFYSTFDIHWMGSRVIGRDCEGRMTLRPSCPSYTDLWGPSLGTINLSGCSGFATAEIGESS